MMNKKRTGVGATLATAVISLALLTASPANAHEDQSTSTTVSMEFVPMTRENAADAGYEVRENPDGTLYAVPSGAVEGSREGEVFVAADRPGLSRGTIYGNCGYATVDFLSKSVVATSYRINPSFGLPVSHNWQLIYSSPIELVSQNLSGIPSWGSQSWATTASVKGEARKGDRLTVMASGSVLTSFGYCTSGNPTAVVTF